jgi:hypothetical protein
LAVAGGAVATGLAVAGGAVATGLAVAGAAGFAGAFGAGFCVEAGGFAVVVCASSDQALRSRTELAETTRRETRRTVGNMSFISRSWDSSRQTRLRFQTASQLDCSRIRVIPRNTGSKAGKNSRLLE